MTQYKTTLKIEGSENIWMNRVEADSPAETKVLVREHYKDRQVRDLRVKRVKKGQELSFGVLKRKEES